MRFSPIDLAYIAGFIDGEGTVSIKINKGGKWKTILPYILITNTDLSILQEIKNILKCGKINIKKSTCERWKEAYVLKFNTTETKYLAPILKDFLRLKNKQINLVLEYITIGSALGNKDNWNKKEKIMKEVQLLNKRGPI